MRQFLTNVLRWLLVRDAGCGMRYAKKNHRDYGIEQNDGLGALLYSTMSKTVGQKGPVIDQFGGFLLSSQIKSPQVGLNGAPLQYASTE